MSPLAYLIAAEWNSVTTGSLKQHTLPLTSLACRAIDDLDPENPQNIREQVIEDLHLFIDTELWHPLIRWACNVFGELDTRRAEGGIGNFKRQAWKTRNVLKNWMMTYLPPPA